MRIRQSSQEQSDIINITSLLDVMFILLIFFMATTTFKEEEFPVGVQLPVASKKHETASSKTKTIIVNVRNTREGAGEGLYIVGGKQVTLQQMQKLVEDAITSDASQAVWIRADKHAYHGEVANAISTCRNAGVMEAKLLYESKPTN
ncbi:MAG: biopolymer transporter ExbD [Phycisphaerae bacterium]|jgi:biopolymer transport protein ExbD|nr:biopolymer transporter ExbD [Phycisphaerae bacterium]